MGIRDCLRYGHDSVFIVSCLGYMVVGLGSMAFHATLKCMSRLGPIIIFPSHQDLGLELTCFDRFHAVGR